MLYIGSIGGKETCYQHPRKAGEKRQQKARMTTMELKVDIREEGVVRIRPGSGYEVK